MRISLQVITLKSFFSIKTHKTCRSWKMKLLSSVQTAHPMIIIPDDELHWIKLRMYMCRNEQKIRIFVVHINVLRNPNATEVMLLTRWQKIALTVVHHSSRLIPGRFRSTVTRLWRVATISGLFWVWVERKKLSHFHDNAQTDKGESFSVKTGIEMPQVTASAKIQEWTQTLQFWRRTGATHTWHSNLTGWRKGLHLPGLIHF